MPATRRSVLAGAMAITGVGGRPTRSIDGRTPLAESTVVMAEDGTLSFLGMSRQSLLTSVAMSSWWRYYRLARLTGDTAAMAELTQKARAGDARLAELFRADGYGETEIAAYLDRLQHDETDDLDFIGGAIPIEQADAG